MKKILFILDRQYIDAHFCFRELITSLTKSGFEVTLYHIQTVNTPDITASSHFKIKTFSKSIWGTLIFVLNLFVANFRYNVIITTPQWPLYWTNKMRFKRSTKLVCLSDEVNTFEINEYAASQKNQGHKAAKWKQREAKAHRNCDATIALGKERYELVKKINSLGDDHAFFIIPNAPSEELAGKNKINYYRTNFNLSQDDTLVIHSGGLQWKLLDKLNDVQLAADQKIILQARQKKDSRFTSPSIVVFDKFIPYKDMVSYSKGADIGLLLYDESDPEEKRNGNTSGKLGLYLAAGLPIIGCNLKVFEWLEKEKCGIRISDLSDLSSAITQIKSNYKEYSDNSRRMFLEKFEYERSFRPFAAWLSNC